MEVILQDIHAVDRSASAYYSESSDERRNAKLVLSNLEYQHGWLQIFQTMRTSSNVHTKIYSLEVAEKVIGNRWDALLPIEKEQLRSLIGAMILEITADGTAFRRDRALVNKLNYVLVKLLRRYWWPGFIEEIVTNSMACERFCENSLNILRLLVESFSSPCESFSCFTPRDVGRVSELFKFVLSSNTKTTELLKATVATFHAFLPFVDPADLFALVTGDILWLLPGREYHSLVLTLFCEVIENHNTTGAFNKQCRDMYTGVITKLKEQETVSPETCFCDFAKHSNDNLEFVQHLAVFFTEFFKRHVDVLLCTRECRYMLLTGHKYLVGFSYIDDDEVTKVCMEYWYLFVARIPAYLAKYKKDHYISGKHECEELDQIFSSQLPALRLLMIRRMPKPEEFVNFLDDDGNIVHDVMDNSDSDREFIYQTMQCTLKLLLNIDVATQQMMLSELDNLRLASDEIVVQHLNPLCCAIGSISVSIPVEQANLFCQSVMDKLLLLYETLQDKEDLRVSVAMCTLSVVEQYPSYMASSWHGLKKVVDTIFTYMSIGNAGVKDLVCDIFFKIAQKCKGEFVRDQDGECLVSYILSRLSTTMAFLQPYQARIVFKSVGTMIQAEPDSNRRDVHLQRLLEVPDMTLDSIIGQAGEFDKLRNMLDNEINSRRVLEIIQIYTSVCATSGASFLRRINPKLLRILDVYKMYSDLISITIINYREKVSHDGTCAILSSRFNMENGPSIDSYASATTEVKLFRSVRKEVLKLVETYFDVAEEPLVFNEILSVIKDPFLGDYGRNMDYVKEANVLSLYATIINRCKCKDLMTSVIPDILGATLARTFEMIINNAAHFSDHRHNLFSLLLAIVTHCSSVLNSSSPDTIELLMRSTIFALEHLETDTAEKGLKILLAVLHRLQFREFYKLYFKRVLSAIFGVLTDKQHMSGFLLQVTVLQYLYCLSSNLLSLCTTKTPSVFIRETSTRVLLELFGDMRAIQAKQFADKLYHSKDNFAEFQEHAQQLQNVTSELIEQQGD